MATDAAPDTQGAVAEAESRLMVLIRQLQGTLAGSVTVAGTVASVNNSRTVVVRNGPGDYTINFNTPFSSIPVATATAFFSGGATTARVYDKTPSSVSVATFTTTTGALIDSSFDFVVRAAN